ncbi:MAG: copper chaperone PCu(A)C [Sphingomonadales bacterium]|nr:copper chaperone PCu(A)C [Sphingomonadales bacterium]
MRAAGFVVVALGLLAGCHPPRAARAGLSVTNARLVLAAVPGHPAAAYFTITNQGSAPVTVTGIEIAGVGRSEMHQTDGGAMRSLPTLAVPAGQAMAFSPGGRHVMAFAPSATLRPGTTGRITLHFADGGRRSAPLHIEAAGGDDAMAGMKM